MTYEDINRLFEEASKVLHLDSSHDAIRQKVQSAISAAHRKENAASDSTSYYNTPYVRDVFGTEDGGQVVHSKDGKMTLSKYKKSADGGYSLSDHKSVKTAYVVDNEDKKEALTILLDGVLTEVQESASSAAELTEVIELQEADAKTGSAKITLISAGKGNSGFYTEAALKKAAKDGIFAEGTHMFLNHQTKQERAERPEGDITKLAAKTTAPAVYVAGENGQPGRLVAPATIYPEYKDFIASRKSDIGVSVRVGAAPSGKVQDGVPLVENMIYALSADFVTRAGRGGKIEELYESFRGRPGQRQPAATEDKMTDEEKRLVTQLQEANASLATRMDRLAEQNQQLVAASLCNEALSASGLKPRGAERVRKEVLAVLPLKDGVLDTVKLQESLTKAITDEKAYLQEAGVQPLKVVRHLGADLQLTEADGKEKNGEKLLTEADGKFTSSIDSILGRKSKEKTA